MRRPVLAADARPVHQEADRQLLQAHVHSDLVKGPLQKRFVNRHEGPHPARRHAGGQGDGVFLSDAHVEQPIREALVEGAKARAFRHGGGDHANILPGFRQFRNIIPAHCANRRAAFAAGTSRFNVERSHAVVFFRCFLRLVKAAALLGDHMDDHRMIHVFQAAEHFFQP